MELSNAVFLDYTNYNQDEYAENVSHYEDSYIVTGFTMSGDSLDAGILFYNGWHLEFTDQFAATPIEGQTIYIEVASQLGSYIQDVYNTEYIPGTVTATVLQASASSGYPLYTYNGTEWELVSNGRIDSVNNIKADLSNNLTIEASDIPADDPTGLTADNVQDVFQNINDRVNDLTGGGLTETQADARYERALSINNSYTNADFDGMNAAEIINYLLTPFSGYGAGVMVGTGNGATTLPALHSALTDLVYEFYGVAHGGGSINMRLEVVGRNLNGGANLDIAYNNDVTYKFSYDNYGTDYTTVNADAFQTSVAYVGHIIQDDKWDSVQKREVVMYDGGRSFIEDGQTVILNKGGYSTMASFEKVTLLFERFDTDAFEQLGYGYKQVHQQNFSISDDGFYNTNTELFPLSFAVDDPKIATKAWNISSAGTLAGKSLNSATNRGYVLVAVIGTVTESAFEGQATTRSNRMSTYKTIPVSELAADVTEIIMADGENAYDIYDMNEEQVSALKAELAPVGRI